MSPTEKTTLVIGASTNPDRTSFTALHMLKEEGVPVVALGLKPGEVAGTLIHTERSVAEGQAIHTVTLYMNAQRQAEWEDWILARQPQRIIFNPGAENPALAKKAAEMGIETRMACTLVMLNFGQF